MLGLSCSPRMDQHCYSLYGLNCLQLKLWFILEVSFYRSCSLWLWISHKALLGVLLSCLGSAPRCCLTMLEKLLSCLQLYAGRLVLYLLLFFEPLVNCWNIIILSFFYRYCFCRCSSELAELFPLPLSSDRSTHYFSWLHDFFWSLFLDVKRMSV